MTNSPLITTLHLEMFTSSGPLVDVLIIVARNEEVCGITFAKGRGGSRMYLHIARRFTDVFAYC